MAGWNDNGRSYGGGGYNNSRSGYSNSYNGNRSGSGSYNNRSSYGQQKELPPEITPKKVPEDYVDEAERIMRSLMSGGKTVTTSKIRNLLSLVTDIYNEENIRTEEKLRPESVVKLNLMRVRVAYECGRDDNRKKLCGADEPAGIPQGHFHRPCGPDPLCTLHGSAGRFPPLLRRQGGVIICMEKF